MNDALVAFLTAAFSQSVGWVTVRLAAARGGCHIAAQSFPLVATFSEALRGYLDVALYKPESPVSLYCSLEAEYAAGIGALAVVFAPAALDDPEQWPAPASAVIDASPREIVAVFLLDVPAEDRVAALAVQQRLAAALGGASERLDRLLPLPGSFVQDTDARALVTFRSLNLDRRYSLDALDVR